MANTFELAQKFLPILDEVYMKESKSSALETRDGVLFTGANTIKLYETNMDGLGDYDRQNGFITGDVNGAWNPYTLEIDRGRSFTIDVMDNDETLGMAFGTLAGEFLRTKVVPENDAYTFAKIAGTDGISHGTHDALADITDATDELDKGIAQLNEDEVPDTDRLCYVSEKFYQKIQGAVTKSITTSQIHFANKEDDREIGANIPGTVIKLLVAEGDSVKQGQPVAILEAMKMETNVLATQDGTVEKIYVKEGDSVKSAQLIARLAE